MIPKERSKTFSQFFFKLFPYVQDEETEEDEDETDDENIDPKNGKYRDDTHDPYEGWRKIAGNEAKEIDIKAVLLDDPDLKNVWDNQGKFIVDSYDRDKKFFSSFLII